MILPATYATALLLTILSMLCWGSWANTFKLAGKWRFELFYFDYALGVLIAALVAAFTLGTMGSDLSFTDNLLITGKTQIVYGVVAGVIFNLANMLLVAAISVAGMAVAFPIGIGLALVIGVIWNYFINPQGNPLLLGAGVALVLVAIVLDALAYARHARAIKRAEQSEKAATAAASEQAPPAKNPLGRGKMVRKRRVRTSSVALKGIVLSLVSGILMGSFYPLVETSKRGDNGLGPYTVAVVFAIGVFLSTFVFNLYFMNLPVEGEPVALGQYFRGSFRQHALGLAGGIIWCSGAIANFAAASAPKEIQVGPAISYAIGQGATMVSALWGVLVWREFAGAGRQVRLLLMLMFLVFLVGLTLVSIAPLYVR